MHARTTFAQMRGVPFPASHAGADFDQDADELKEAGLRNRYSIAQ
jgi:hypothetical protein